MISQAQNLHSMSYYYLNGKIIYDGFPYKPNHGHSASFMCEGKPVFHLCKLAIVCLRVPFKCLSRDCALKTRSSRDEIMCQPGGGAVTNADEWMIGSSNK